MSAKLIGWLFLFTYSAAYAQRIDVGLVNLVSGDVVFMSFAATSDSKVQAYMRLQDGDRIQVPAGGQVGVVFFDGARHERWIGPAVFRTRQKASEPISGEPAAIVQLPISTPHRIARIPELVRNARLGGMRIRDGRAQAQADVVLARSEMTATRTDYEHLRREMPADDITPELFLYAALYERQSYGDLRTVVTEMLRKQPNNEDVKALDAWLRAVLAP